jgi:hypothetical protein
MLQTVVRDCDWPVPDCGFQSRLQQATNDNQNTSGVACLGAPDGHLGMRLIRLPSIGRRVYATADVPDPR